MCPGAYKTQALPRAPPRALTNQTWTATSRPTSDCRSLSSFFHSASSFLVCCHLVFCLSCWQALFSLRLTLLHFASISPSGTFFSLSTQRFFTHTTPTAQFPLLSPSLEVPLYFAATQFYSALAKGLLLLSPQFIFPALLCLLCLKLVLPLLELLERCILSRLWSDCRKPSSDGTWGGSVWDVAQGKQRGQVNEARRQLCVKRHQYSAEAPFAPSSNNIPVIQVSHITLPP